MCDQNPVFIAGPANTPDRFRRAIAALGLKLVVNEPHLASNTISCV
jgi:aspartate aminotransferase-like enzyme